MDSLLLATAAVFFPLWMGIWEQNPFEAEDVKDTFRTVMPEQAFSTIRKCLPACDARLKAEIYIRLAQHPIRANQDFLLELLKQEQDASLQATILMHLAGTGIETLSSQAVEAFLQSESPAVAEAAIRLYGQLPDAVSAKLVPFLEPGVSPVLQRAAWDVFQASPKLASALGQRVLEYQEGPFGYQALATALRQERRLPETSAWLAKASAGSELWKAVAAKDPRPELPVLKALLHDKDARIRCAVLNANAGTFRGAVASALSDTDASVRQAALQALGRYQEAPDADVLRKIAQCLADKNTHVRSEAAELYCKLGASQEGVEILTSMLDDSQPPEAHYQAYRVLARLPAQNSHEFLAAKAMQEKRPEVLGAAIDALALLAPKGSHEEMLRKLSSHPAPVVRAAVAGAFGRLAIPGTQALLIEMAKDKHTAVRAEVMEAMGRFPDISYVPSILACLKDTGKTESEERNNAAWSAGHLPCATPEQRAALQPLLKRLITQATVAVIPTPMEPAFENTEVIGNCIVSIIYQAKKSGCDDFQDSVDGISAIYHISMADLERLRGNATGPSDSIPRSALTYSIIHQALQYLDGKEMTRQEIPDTKMSFPLEDK